MVRYVIRRLLWAIVLFIAVTVVTYMIFFLIPVDPARLAAGKSATPAEVKAVAHRLYLDRPVYEQYLHFLDQLVFHGSLGYSFNDRQSVNSSIFARGAGDGVARARRCGGVDADRRAHRHPLGPASRGRCSTASPWSACSAASPPTRCGSASWPPTSSGTS